MSTTHSYYHYDPSVPVAAVAAVLFTLACVAGIIQTIRYKSSVWWVMIVAAVCEAAGFIARVPSAVDPQSRTIYIVSFALVVLAPVLMAAACYVVFVSEIVVLVVCTNSQIEGQDRLPRCPSTCENYKDALGSSAFLDSHLCWLRYQYV